MKWEDFNAQNGTLKICRSIGKDIDGKMLIGDTKTGNGVREIILPPSTADLLRSRKKNAVSEWIFPSHRMPEKPIHPQSAYVRLKAILQQAGLPSIGFHNLRHTFATHAIAGGVDAKTLSGILGHSNASFTMNIRYGHAVQSSHIFDNKAALRGKDLAGRLIFQIWR